MTPTNQNQRHETPCANCGHVTDDVLSCWCACHKGACRICRRPEVEHRDRNGHGFVAVKGEPPHRAAWSGDWRDEDNAPPVEVARPERDDAAADGQTFSGVRCELCGVVRMSAMYSHEGVVRCQDHYICAQVAQLVAKARSTYGDLVEAGWKPADPAETIDGQANDCTHASASGVDAAPLRDPDKAWRCDHCGLRWSSRPPTEEVS